MKPFDNCPICGGELTKKKIEKIVRGGNHTAVIKVNAEVCLKCGEILFDEKVVKYFEFIKEKLKKQDTVDFTPIGQNFLVSDTM